MQIYVVIEGDGCMSSNFDHAFLTKEEAITYCDNTVDPDYFGIIKYDLKTHTSELIDYRPPTA